MGELGGVERGETVLGIYCIREESLQLNKKEMIMTVCKKHSSHWSCRYIIYWIKNKVQEFCAVSSLQHECSLWRPISILIQKHMSTRQHTSAQSMSLDLVTHLKYIVNCPSVRPKEGSRALLAIVSLLTVQNLNAYAIPLESKWWKYKHNWKHAAFPTSSREANLREKLLSWPVMEQTLESELRKSKHSWNMDWV